MQPQLLSRAPDAIPMSYISAVQATLVTSFHAAETYTVSIETVRNVIGNDQRFVFTFSYVVTYYPDPIPLPNCVLCVYVCFVQ